jgi:hypothetical protein
MALHGAAAQSEKDDLVTMSVNAVTTVGRKGRSLCALQHLYLDGGVGDRVLMRDIAVPTEPDGKVDVSSRIAGRSR